MTEEEAKAKWCPMARSKNEDFEGVTVNRSYRYGKADADCMCLASDCMMWQWIRETLAHINSGGAITSLLPEGYCGLSKK